MVRRPNKKIVDLENVSREMLASNFAKMRCCLVNLLTKFFHNHVHFWSQEIAFIRELVLYVGELMPLQWKTVYWNGSGIFKCYAALTNIINIWIQSIICNEQQFICLPLLCSYIIDSYIINFSTIENLMAQNSPEDIELSRQRSIFCKRRKICVLNFARTFQNIIMCHVATPSNTPNWSQKLKKLFPSLYNNKASTE